MPKRVNNIYVKNITFSKLLEAHNKCKKHKRFKKQVIEFEMNLENNLIKRKIKDKHFLRLTKKIIFYDDEKVSIPIGNYTSQIYANIYLNELDRFIKQSLKVKYLVRYMDDFIILTNSKNNAKYFLREIKAFLNDKLKLELNAKTAYFKAKQGVNFCGFRIWKTHRLLREQSKKKMKRKLKIFQKLYKENKIELEYILACINSWRGHAKHCNSYNLEHKMFNEFVLRK